MNPAHAQLKEVRTSFLSIWRLSWPLILMMLFHFLLGYVNVWVAGKIGTKVQAAVGVITQTMFFFLIVAIALANGGVAAVSQSLGACLHERARKFAGLCLEIGLVAAVVCAVSGQVFLNEFLDILRIPEDVKPVASDFLKINLNMLPANYFLVIVNAIFRAGKKVRLQMYTMILNAVINIVGDFGFGLGYFGMPALGYKGLAWSSFISVHVGALLGLVLFRYTGWLKLRMFPPLRWIRSGMPYLFKVAWPAGLMQLLWQAGYLVLYAVTASLPYDRVVSLAAMTAGIRTEAVLFMPAFAFNMTASILIGHALGASRRDEARLAGLKVWALGCAFICLIALVLWIFKDQAAGVLTSDPKVKAELISYLSWNLAAAPFTATSMIIGGALTGAGATIFNLTTFGMAMWAIRLPLAYYLGHILLENATGVWIAMFASQAVQASTMLYFYLFRDWYKYAMIKKKDRRTVCED